MQNAEYLVQSLEAALSIDSNERKQGEDALKLLSVTEEYGLLLLHIISNERYTLESRKLASVLLRQYVMIHWQESSDCFQAPVVPDNIKIEMRSGLFNALEIDICRINIASTLAILATWEFPDIANALVHGLNSDNTMIGCMVALEEFAKECTESQIPILIQQLAPCLNHHIRGDNEEIVSGACKILTELLDAFGMKKSDGDPTFLLEAVCQALSKNFSAETSSYCIQAMTGLLPRCNVAVGYDVLWKVFCAAAEDYHRDTSAPGRVKLAAALFESVESSVRHAQKVLSSIVKACLIYMQATSAQIELWENDISAYMAEDEGMDWSVRNGAADLIQSIDERWPLADVLFNLSVDDCLKEPWIKACGLLQLAPPQSLWDMFPDRPITLATLLFAAARCDNVPPKMLQLAANSLDPSHMCYVRVSAADAITELGSPEFGEKLADPLLKLAIDFNEEGDVVSTVINALAAVINDATLLTKLEPTLGPYICETFVRHVEDPQLQTAVQDIVSLFVKQGLLIDRILRPVMTLIKSNQPGYSSVGLDCLLVVVRSSQEPPSSQIFFTVVHSILTSNDSSTLSSGSDAMRAIIVKCGVELSNFNSSDGMTGLQGVAAVVLHLLSPDVPEFSALCIGKLVAVVVNYLGNLVKEFIGEVLRAVLTKMQQSQSVSVVMSLVLIYAMLINHELESVFDLLSRLPDPRGNTALQYVLVEWVKNQANFYGSYERKTTSVALSKVLKYLLDNPDHAMFSVTVEVDNPEINTKRSSRSQGLPPSSHIPLPCRIHQLLIQELMSAVDAEYVQSDDNEEGDSEEENGVISLDQYFHDKSRQYAGDDSDDDDYDFKSDQCYNVDLAVYLKEFLNQLKALSCYNDFIQHLKKSEKLFLTTI